MWRFDSLQSYMCLSSSIVSVLRPAPVAAAGVSGSQICWLHGLHEICFSLCILEFRDECSDTIMSGILGA